MKFLLAPCFCLIVLALNFAAAEKDWWENGNFYQIYPRSFMDSNGDGIGDLNGITSQLPYLKDIGMNAIWLSPIYESPMYDFGYDISDYRQIHPDYGTVEDLQNLQHQAKQLGIHVIMDYVPNHTSDEHEWFKKSVNGDPEYKDFYIWHDGVVDVNTGERRPPSNWPSQFRYSAWEWNEVRQQYYLHQFGVRQPDLNYRNPVVVQNMKDIIEYWLSKGVDGFRIDAVPFFFEVEVDPETGTYPDEPVTEDVANCPDPDDWCHYQPIYTNSLPETIDMLYQFREVIDNWRLKNGGDTKVLLTEAYTSFDKIVLLYGADGHNGAQVPFNFELFTETTNRSTAADFSYYISHWLDNMPEGVYANWVLGNHDNRRIASRYGIQRTDLINILLQTLPGIAITYNGEEYGMEDVNISWEDTVDIQGCSATPENYQRYTRDPARTPFRWDSSRNAGFSNASSTWLVVGEGYEESNVALELAAENSHLKIFRHVVQLRKAEAAFQDGGYESRVVEGVLLYRRQADEGDAFIVVLNIGDVDEVLDLTQLYDNVGPKVQVEVSSLQSGIQNGQTLNSNSFAAAAYNAYVLRVIDN